MLDYLGRIRIVEYLFCGIIILVIIGVMYDSYKLFLKIDKKMYGMCIIDHRYRLDLSGAYFDSILRIIESTK